ncbi:MAG: DUF5668 domain-containing protein [Lachnospiraceae bacterium]|nr:DUF5668 domain-containing protein [Lachnospiraceae bacterium]
MEASRAEGVQSMEAERVQMSETVSQPQRTRRVGSVTFGLTLILFGVLFLVNIMLPTLHYEMIFRLWPVVFIFLGIEILVENHRTNAEKCRFVYDFPAIIMLVLLLLFAMMMAAVDYAFTYQNLYYW